MATHMFDFAHRGFAAGGDLNDIHKPSEMMALRQAVRDFLFEIEKRLANEGVNVPQEPPRTPVVTIIHYGAWDAVFVGDQNVHWNDAMKASEMARHLGATVHVADFPPRNEFVVAQTLKDTLRNLAEVKINRLKREKEEATLVADQATSEIVTLRGECARFGPGSDVGAILGRILG